MPKNFVLARALTGDPSDSIDGIKGVGLKTSLKLFPLINDDKSMFPVDLIDYAKLKITDSKSQSNTKYHKILSESEKLDRNYKIMQLRDPLVSSSGITKMIDILSKSTKANIPKVRQMFIMDQMWSQIKNFEDWVLQFIPLQSKEKE